MRMLVGQHFWPLRLVKQKHLQGNPVQSWAKLTKKSRPQTPLSYIQIAKKLVNSKLDLHNDPEDWSTTLEGLKTDMNETKIKNKTAMLDNDLIIHILSSLMEKYEAAVSFLEKGLTNKSG